MEIVKLKGEDMSGRNIVVCAHKFNKFSGQTTKFFETFFLENLEDIYTYLLFDACDNCRIKGYEILKRFGKVLYSGLNFQQAMKARI